MADVNCADPRHALRSADPGWSTKLGEGPVAATWGLCEACRVGRDAESTVDTAGTRTAISIAQGGDCVVTVLKKYLSGEVVGQVQKRGTLADSTLTSAEKTQLRALLAKVRDWLLVVSG